MALVIDLKPGEKILIGEAVITNDSQRTRLHIAGDAPILREKDVMKTEDANTPCKRIYFIIQAMYLSKKPEDLHADYFAMVADVQKAAPSCGIFISQINDEIINNHYYKAMKLGKQLIEHEDELLNSALGKSKIGQQG
jgi:flagellar protein FlbT